MVIAICVSLLVGCSSDNKTTTNNPGVNQPAKTSPTTVSKGKEKELLPINCQKALEELGVFANKEIWEDAEILNKKIYFNVKSGEKITFPFDVEVISATAPISVDVVNTDTKVKETKYIKGIIIKTFKPQQDGTYKKDYLCSICSTDDKVGKGATMGGVIVKAGETVAVVSSDKVYAVSNDLTKVPDNKPNIIFYFWGSVSVSDNADSKEFYHDTLLKWLEYDKDSGSGS